uniref:Uncharacterized protein n=1 Tax=Alexandrium andersonii TaxID=327968 RepID=A0A6U6R8F5_9DINO|mmetsp:Transcript_62605/g.140843  ORF Transcript_62605/g.140843 Transcript_62605/m.140843 type:complete len:165 (+) Transcript_62605:128-622(+)
MLLRAVALHLLCSIGFVSALNAQVQQATSLLADRRLCSPRRTLPQGDYSFLPDNGMACLEGSREYLNDVLSRLRKGPLSSMYAGSKVEALTCKNRKYGVGQCEDHCFRKLRVRMRLNPRDGAHMMKTEWDLFKVVATERGVPLGQVYDDYRDNCDPDHEWTFTE